MIQTGSHLMFVFLNVEMAKSHLTKNVMMGIFSTLMDAILNVSWKMDSSVLVEMLIIQTHVSKISLCLLQT